MVENPQRITRFQVGATRYVVGPAGVVTRLPNGAIVRARPRADQAQTARDLGYGDDVAAMTRDHDPLHVRLCGWLGLSASFSLRAAAGEVSDEIGKLAVLEEAAVIAVQRFARAAGCL